MRCSRWRWNRRKSRWLLEFIPLLAEERWRDSLIEAGAPGWSVRPEYVAELTTPSAPSLRSAYPVFLCEEGNNTRFLVISSLTLPKAEFSTDIRDMSFPHHPLLRPPVRRASLEIHSGTC